MIDTADLDDISSLSWVQAGDAIYMAAEMIGKEIHPVIPSGERSGHVASDSTVSESAFADIYPNPANNFFIINTGGFQLKSIYIYNMQGKLLAMPFAGENVINCSAYTSGIYTVKLIDINEKEYFKRLNIIR